MVNRTQKLVLGFVAAAWLSLIVILVTAPEVYDETLPDIGNRVAVETGFLVLLTAFLAVLSLGVLRRWRWTFWLTLAAFLLGVVRTPVAVLQLTGALDPSGPKWYAVFQGAVGLVQFGIGLVMLHDYRRFGTWGAS